MQLTEQKRQATMHNVLLKLQQMLPSHSERDLQTLLEQLDRDALTVARGEEDAYINRMASKLGNIQRNVRKSQGQAAAGAPQHLNQRTGSAPGARQDIGRAGSDHSSGSSRSFNQQHQLLMQQQQQQALLGVRQQMAPPGRQAPVPQTPWAAQHPPAHAQQRYAPQQMPQRQQAHPQAQAHAGAYAAAGLSHVQPDARLQQPSQQPGVYDPHQAAWRSQQQRQPALAAQQQQQHLLQGQQQQMRPVGGGGPSGAGVLQATHSMEQMAYGLILAPGQQQQPAHQAAPQQAPTAPASQAPSFMEMLTSDAPQQQHQQQQLAPPAQVPRQAPGHQLGPSYAPPAASAAPPVASPAAAGAMPQQKPGGGEDCTDAYWALMARVQADIVPSLEHLQPRFTAGSAAAGAKAGAPDWERLRAKMAEILRLLPRLKIRRDDPRYAARVWTRHEYEQMQKIERQLGPYCDRFFPKGRPTAGTADAALAGQAGSMAPASTPSPAPQQPASMAQPSKESLASQTALPAAPSPHLSEQQPDAALPPAQEPAVAPAKLPSRPPSTAAPPLDRRQQLLQAAASYGTAAGGGAASVERLLAHQAGDAPLPPPHLLPPALNPQATGQVVSRRRPADGGTSGSPTSVLDALDAPLPPAKRRKLDPAASQELEARRRLLQAECAEASAQLGERLQLQVGEQPGADGTLLVHMQPGPSDARPWQVLTLQTAPGHPASAPHLTLPSSSAGDAREHFQAEAAWDLLTARLSSERQPLAVETAARAWQAALAAVCGASPLPRPHCLVTA